MAPAPAEQQEGRRSSRWGDLRIRVISAAVLGPVALICIWVGGFAFGVLVAVGAIGLSVEWSRMTRPSRSHAGWFLGGLVYFALAAAAVVSIREDPVAGRANFLFLVLLVWASDIGAYVAGRSFGGPRLAPSISPGKTFSGAGGGLLCAVLVGLGAAVLVPAPLWRAGLLGGLLGVVAQAGDLLESFAKRSFGVKDSSRLIPGHGGLLDRLDALLAVVLAAWVLVQLEGGGVILWQ